MLFSGLKPPRRSDAEGNLTVPVRLEPFSVAGLTLRR